MKAIFQFGLKTPVPIFGATAIAVGWGATASANPLNSNAIALNFDVPNPVKTPSPQPATEVGLNFEPPPFPETPKLKDTPQHNLQPISEKVADFPNTWWTMGSNSPIAIAIGHAEGTRQPNGQKNPAYYWHRDPGNGADNFVTFSYQHLSSAKKMPVMSASTTWEKRERSAAYQLPEIADRRQLQRLKTFYDRLREQAIAKDIHLSPEELMNGLDLSNQSPNAGLNWMGYIDRLAQMKQRLDDPEEQILEARTWSFWNPHTHRWDASGLGNTYNSIRRDQQRRQQAIARAMAHQIPSVDRVSPKTLAETPDSDRDRVAICIGCYF